MSCVYKPTVLLNSTIHEEPDTDSASLFAQGYDNSILSLAKNADVLSEASRACCPVQDFNKALRPKSTGFCSCRIDPDFENFRNTVLRLLTNVQDDVQGYIQAGISLRKHEYVVLVEIRDRIDRCQRDIMLFIDTFAGENMPRLRRQSSLLEARNAKLQMRANNLLVNELDSDKYLRTEPRREKNLLETDNLALKEELKTIKTKYESQLIRVQDLLDKLLDCIQTDNIVKSRSISSYTRPGSSTIKKSVKGESRITQAKASVTSRHDLQTIKRQLLELKDDTADLQALVKEGKCGPICPHERALHDLLKETRQENAILHLSKAQNQGDSEARIATDIITAAQTMKKLFETAPHPTNSNGDNSLQIENSMLKQELSNQKERVQTLEHENVVLLRELSNTKQSLQSLERVQRTTSSLNDSSERQHDGCKCCAVCSVAAEALNVPVLLQERNALCQKLQKKDAELTRLQTEIDEVMSELISLHERYDELEKASVSDKLKRDAGSAQYPCKPQEQPIYKDVVPNSESRLSSDSVVDFSALYSNHKGINAMNVSNGHSISEKSSKANRSKNKVRAKN